MKVLVAKPFARLAKSEGTEEEKLCEAVRRAEEGGIDANLGGRLIEQRIGRMHGGKAGGFRVPLSFRKDGVAVLPALPRVTRRTFEQTNVPCFANLRASFRQWTCKPLRRRWNQMS